MARVNGPFLSIDASGTIYKTLVASIWKGRNYIRGYCKPTTSQDPGCVAARVLFKAAVTAWQALYLGTKDLWNEAARDVYPPISGFNYWVSQYCLQIGVPTIPAVAPKKSKVIHGR
jgi:hypothetical protein